MREWSSWFAHFGFLGSFVSLFLGFLVSGFLGFLLSCFLGILVSGFLGFWVSGFLGFLVSWFLSFLVSWFLGFLRACFLCFLVSLASGFLGSWFHGFLVSGFLGFCFWVSWCLDAHTHSQTPSTERPHRPAENKSANQLSIQTSKPAEAFEYFKCANQAKHSNISNTHGQTS
jgi:hypothetical protein